MFKNCVYVPYKCFEAFTKSVQTSSTFCFDDEDILKIHEKYKNKTNMNIIFLLETILSIEINPIV